VQTAPTTDGPLPHDAFTQGFFVGLLVGEGHFGGDGRQAQVTLRMHTRHKRVFDWLVVTFPGARLYGPYLHSGRSYYQWMARGQYLRDVIVPLVAAHMEMLDDHVRTRFLTMCERYRLHLAQIPSRTAR